MTNKLPEALRLAATFHISSRIGWRRAALETLRTQHALLVQARDALAYHVEQTRPIHRTAETLAALNQHLDQQ